jgi:hypothetical protein
LMKIRIQQPEDCSERAYDMVRNAYNWILWYLHGDLLKKYRVNNESRRQWLFLERKKTKKIKMTRRFKFSLW